MGELLYLEKHLEVTGTTAECGFISLDCPYGCGESVLSSAIKEHVKHNCMYVCEHCGYYNTREIVTKTHSKICGLSPMECPNECGVENLKRNQLKMHIEQCPLEVIPCLFKSAGCTVQLPRGEMDKHEQTAMCKHLRMMMMSLNIAKPDQKPLSLTHADGDSQFLFNLPPVTFAVRDFLKLKDSDAEWMSLPFYTHPQGYRLCLVVYPNGFESGKGTHMSVFIGLMEGNYDDMLKWPVEIDVSIELISPRAEHCEQTVTVNSDYYRVTKSNHGIKMSPCEVQFIHHSTLLHCNDVENEDITIQFKINETNIVTTPKVKPAPNWQSPNVVSQSMCEFTLTEFPNRKQFNNQFYSPSFLTHENGYKMCLRIHTNGYRSGKNSHLSVYVQLMRGDNDDQLQWPFDGDIVFEILNWSADINHYTDTVSISPILNFMKIDHEGTVGASFGYYETIPLSSLTTSSNRKEYFSFFFESIRFRVRQIAIYSTPIKVKPPSWENSLKSNSQLSVCVFTLTEFSKRKHFDNKFHSRPFYSHQHGYRLCLRVIANGYKAGKGHHVSVYVVIMAGDYDGKQEWPFVGKIKIELINWKANCNHWQKEFDIKATDNYNRVLLGDFGVSNGDHLFISHDALSNSSANTEYLQDDCLRFRVYM